MEKQVLMKLKFLLILLFPIYLLAQNSEIDSLRNALIETELKPIDEAKTLHQLSLSLADINPEEAKQVNEKH